MTAGSRAAARQRSRQSADLRPTGIHPDERSAPILVVEHARIHGEGGQGRGVCPAPDRSRAGGTVDPFGCDGRPHPLQVVVHEVAGIHPQQQALPLARDVRDDDGLPGVFPSRDPDVHVRRIRLECERAQRHAVACADERTLVLGHAQVVDDHLCRDVRELERAQQVEQAAAVIAAGCGDDGATRVRPSEPTTDAPTEAFRPGEPDSKKPGRGHPPGLPASLVRDD